MLTFFPSEKKRVANIIKTGYLCSESRLEAGVPYQGISSQSDHYRGSSDCVFTQLYILGEEDIHLGYWGKVELIFSLKVLNNGSYQFHDDNGGSRRTAQEKLLSYDEIDSDDEGVIHFMDSDSDTSSFSDSESDNSEYMYREPLIDFIKAEKKMNHARHEIMIKEGIGPESIVGCVVSSKERADLLKTTLKEHGLIEIKEGKEWINGMPVDQFICIAKKMEDIQQYRDR